jgi:hypothetical protein
MPTSLIHRIGIAENLLWDFTPRLGVSAVKFFPFCNPRLKIYLRRSQAAATKNA